MLVGEGFGAVVDPRRLEGDWKGCVGKLATLHVRRGREVDRWVRK